MLKIKKLGLLLFFVLLIPTTVLADDGKINQEVISSKAEALQWLEFVMDDKVTNKGAGIVRLSEALKRGGLTFSDVNASEKVLRDLLLTVINSDTAPLGVVVITSISDKDFLHLLVVDNESFDFVSRMSSAKIIIDRNKRALEALNLSFSKVSILNSQPSVAETLLYQLIRGAKTLSVEGLKR